MGTPFDDDGGRRGKGYPSRTVSSPEAGSMDRGPKSGTSKWKWWGVLPTLLPKRIYVTKGTKQRVPVCRA
jgi:hypothetical protein